jgi:hypothetical protein
MPGLGKSENVFAWTVWVDGATELTQRQTYQLRAPGNDENIFVWENSLGGIDSYSATGTVDDDAKLEHKTAISVADLTSEYDVIAYNREKKQSTGYLDAYSAAWLKDFFYSLKKYWVEIVGTTTTFRQIAALTSDIVVSSLNDLTEYSFTYRLSENTKLLNLEREFAAPTEIEGIEELFAGQVVAELAHTAYQDHLKVLVRRPDSQVWEFVYADELLAGSGEAVLDIDFLIVEPFVYNVPVAMKFTSQTSEGTAATLSIALNTNMARYDKLTVTPTEIGLITLTGILL